MTQDFPLHPSDQTSLLGAIQRYWWVVLTVVGVFLALGLLTVSEQEEVFRASAELIITDSRAVQPFTVTDLGDPSSQPSERYLADQVEILRSSEVAREAAVTLGGDFDTRAVLARRRIEGALTSNLIVITFDAPTSQDAKRGADAIAAAYEDIQNARLETAENASLVELDKQLASADRELVDLQQQIDDAQAADSSRREMVRQIEQAGVNLGLLRNQRVPTEIGSDEREALNAQIDELFRDIAVWDLILRIEKPTPGLISLLAELDAVVAERAALASRRNSLVADLEIVGAGIVLYSPALLPQEPIGFRLQFILAAFMAIGLALGASFAYALYVRRWDFGEKSEPEAVLEAPMIGEVPSFSDGITSLTPVATDPSSRSAEAFRFIAEAISTQQDRARAAGEDPAAVVGVAGATADDGTGMVAANVALAYAEQGRRVLVVDADFERRTVTQILVPERAPIVGLAELLQDAVSPISALVRVQEPRRNRVDLLGRGKSSESAAMVFNDERLSSLVSNLADGYDLTLVVSPALLEVAYSTRVLELTDAVLAVVGHGMSRSFASDFRNQLSMVGTPVVGYVYNRAGSGLPQRQPATATL